MGIFTLHSERLRAVKSILDLLLRFESKPSLITETWGHWRARSIRLDHVSGQWQVDMMPCGLGSVSWVVDLARFCHVPLASLDPESTSLDPDSNFGLLDPWFGSHVIKHMLLLVAQPKDRATRSMPWLMNDVQPRLSKSPVRFHKAELLNLKTNVVPQTSNQLTYFFPFQKPWCKVILMCMASHSPNDGSKGNANNKGHHWPKAQYSSCHQRDGDVKSLHRNIISKREELHQD